MSFPYTPRLQDEKLESLQTQHEYLNLLRLRHLQWMSTSDDPETERIHLEIAAGIEEITARYNRLVDALQQEQGPGDGLPPLQDLRTQVSP
jgi:hypothetical protein